MILKQPRERLKAPVALQKQAINKPSITRRMVRTPKYTELHSYSLRDIEKLFDIVIEEPLADANLVHPLSSL